MSGQLRWRKAGLLPPDSPEVGDAYFNTRDEMAYVYSDGKWLGWNQLLTEAALLNDERADEAYFQDLEDDDEGIFDYNPFGKSRRGREDEDTAPISGSVSGSVSRAPSKRKIKL